jgi:uncharacterized protein
VRKSASDIAFSEAVKRVQSERGSRDAYARVESTGGFPTEVDDALRAFLADIDTAFLATASKDGQPYVQHRGGPKGFIRAVDERTLAFVDFAGNRQYVSTGNLSENNRVCLFLVDYERRRRVKVWGTARIVSADVDLVAKLADPAYRGRIEQVVLVTMSAWDVNCPRHIPMKLDAGDVAIVVDTLETRIKELERDNEKLRSRTCP